MAEMFRVCAHFRNVPSLARFQMHSVQNMFSIWNSLSHKKYGTVYKSIILIFTRPLLSYHLGEICFWSPAYFSYYLGEICFFGCQRIFHIIWGKYVFLVASVFFILFGGNMFFWLSAYFSYYLGEICFCSEISMKHFWLLNRNNCYIFTEDRYGIQVDEQFVIVITQD